MVVSSSAVLLREQGNICFKYEYYISFADEPESLHAVAYFLGTGHRVPQLKGLPARRCCE